MADLNDVRRIVAALPGTVEGDGFAVMDRDKPRCFASTWRERVHPNRAKVANPGVLVVWVADVAEKEALVATAPDRFFTEPHYNGYAAVLIRLANISVEELEEVLTDAWRCRAPKDLVDEFDTYRITSPI